MRTPELRPILIDVPEDKWGPKRELTVVEEGAEIPQEVPEKTEKEEYQEKVSREQVDALNTVLQNGITLTNNLNGQILSAVLPMAGTEIAIRHNLKITPKYRIILKHRGDGLVLDGATAWNSTTVYFKASQATEDINITFILMRE